MKPDRLHGVLPVFQTPFHEDGSFDFATLEKEIHWLYDRGADGIVMAMVSETLRLSSTERGELAAAACRFGAKRGAVVLSAGAESTAVAVQYARQAQDLGADAAMVIPPLSVGPGEAELTAYYRAIITAVDIPVIVQDASGYVGRPLSIAVQAKLLTDFGPQRVMYKPEANPIGPKLSQLRDATGGKAKIFEGTGGMALVDSYRRGVVGTMPGADTIVALVALWKALRAGHWRRAYAISGPLTSLIAMLKSLDMFVAVEKHLLVRQGVFVNTVVRGPVDFTLDDETKTEVDRLFDLMMEATRSTDDR